MTTKKTAPPAKSKANTITIKNDKGKSQDRKLAEIGLSATTLNAVTARNYTKPTTGETDLTETILVMREKITNVNAGDMTGLEATLTAQSVSLDAIFNSLALRAQGSDTMTKLEIYMRLALKAQAQCARTIEVITAMKNPPIVYVKQANISNGNQQVNNGNVSNGQAPAHTGEIRNQPNELLRESNNAAMDTSRTTTTSGTDKAMATMES